MRIIYFLGFLFLNVANVCALGINCRGSSQCNKFFSTLKTKNLINLLNETMWASVSDEAYFYQEENIMCDKNANWAVGGFCLFLQGNTPLSGVNGSVLKSAISYLAAHGCHTCGSVPIGPNNDPSIAGWLTVNYVRYPSCLGLCIKGYLPPASSAIQVTTVNTGAAYSSLAHGVVFTGASAPKVTFPAPPIEVRSANDDVSARVARTAQSAESTRYLGA